MDDGRWTMDHGPWGEGKWSGMIVQGGSGEDGGVQDGRHEQAIRSLPPGAIRHGPGAEATIRGRGKISCSEPFVEVCFYKVEVDLYIIELCLYLRGGGNAHHGG